MALQDLAHWHRIYSRLLAMEAQMRELRNLILTLKPDNGQPVICHNPVPLGGIWEGADISDNVIEAAKRSMFSYEHRRPQA